MDVKQELQKLREYREQLRELAKPGLGPFEKFKADVLEEGEEDILHTVAEDPTLLSDVSEKYRILCFDYFISIPLLSVIYCRNQFNNPEQVAEWEDMELQYQTLASEGELELDDISLLLDLLHPKLQTPPDAEPQDKRVIDDFQLLTKDLSDPSVLSEPLNIFKRIASIGQDVAVICLINKKAGIYRNIEWETIEGILRSQIFPDFFVECEKKAQTAEVTHYNDAPTTSAHEFTLPDDFFKHPPTDTPEEYFNIEYIVQKKGAKSFCKLINFISSNGYIADDDRTKQLLAYILSGRGKPEDYREGGETITWKDKDHAGKELCFLIKILIVPDQGKKATKYKKMHKLFTGPNWNENVPDKDQGNNAEKNFKDALKDIYPELCKI